MSLLHFFGNKDRSLKIKSGFAISYDSHSIYSSFDEIAKASIDILGYRSAFSSSNPTLYLYEIKLIGEVQLGDPKIKFYGND